MFSARGPLGPWPFSNVSCLTFTQFVETDVGRHAELVEKILRAVFSLPRSRNPCR